MTIIYVITDTKGVDQFSIEPGTFDGAGGTDRNTDLKLFGQGFILWGEQVNENQLRLAESFATPEKSTPDEGTPQGDAELGLGNGINLPLAGQIWWNTTQERLFVFDGTAWQPIQTARGTTEPANPQTGDFWFDENVPQLKVFDGSNFVSVAERYLLLDGSAAMTGALDMDSNLINNVLTPVAGTDGANKDYVDGEVGSLQTSLTGGLLDSQYVNLTGDTMTGSLILNADPVIALEAATKQYVDMVAGFETGDFKASANTTPPSGWLLCDGSTIGDTGSGADFEGPELEDLFDVLNVAGAWGNPGGASFAGLGTVLLPDFQGRSPIGVGTGPDTAEGGGPGTTRALGVKGGAETHTLTEDEMPRHRHTEQGNDGVVNLKGFSPNPLEVGNQTRNTGFAGNDDPHNNMHPFLGVNYFIKI